MPLQNPNNRKKRSAIFAMDMDGKFACRYKIQTTVKNALQFLPSFFQKSVDQTATTEQCDIISASQAPFLGLLQILGGGGSSTDLIR